MSRRRSTEELVGELAFRLAPVRRVARLRVVLGAAAALSAGVAVSAFVRAGGARPDLAQRMVEDPVFGAQLAALGLLAGGGAVAASAEAVPGRGGVARLGGAAACAGVLVAMAALTRDWMAPGAARLPVEGDLACLSHALALGLAPGVALVAYVARGAPWHLARAGLLAAMAAAAVGGAAVHATCESPEAAHWWWGHASGPLVAAGLTAPGLALWVRRRRSPRAGA